MNESAFCFCLYHLYHTEHAVRRDQHNDARRDDAAENETAARAFWAFSAVLRSAHRPRAGSRKRNSNEEIQSETGVFCDLAAFAQQFFLVRSSKLRSGGRVSAHSSSFPRTRAAAEWEHIAEDGQRKSVVHGIPAAAPVIAPRSSRAHHGNDKNGRLAPRAEQPVK